MLALALGEAAHDEHADVKVALGAVADARGLRAAELGVGAADASVPAHLGELGDSGLDDSALLLLLESGAEGGLGVTTIATRARGGVAAGAEVSAGVEGGTGVVKAGAAAVVAAGAAAGAAGATAKPRRHDALFCFVTRLCLLS
eukprot:CAMPEP_0171497248 /NCGR_PEP_ID=MMETSP0958-20121227/7159_1 /TAXON_ID=87120 /ORGANISM="Aurantiochytrium limacinum, Strain ATCCMYA-1381" /LENGTH=143 /DNA_ID=CAMNT_0012031455 /DNA_START=430 /DNA_END=861 /DNA_ORIENTATION=-